MRDLYLDSLLESFGVDPAVRSIDGVTVAGSPTRSAGQAAGYEVGEHLVITCDPSLEPTLLEVTVDLAAPQLPAWQQLAHELQGELLGSGRQQVVSPYSLCTPKAPSGCTTRSLDASSDADQALIAELIEASDPEDLDEAEVDLDELDPIIEVMLDDQGRIAAYSGARPFELVPRFGDIGILTRTDCRGLGIGSALVAALCVRIRAAGLEPVYRCDENNAASIALSARLGFEIAAKLAVYHFPELIR